MKMVSGTPQYNIQWAYSSIIRHNQDRVTFLSNPNIEPEIKLFQDFLKRRGMRHTREREAIVREILSSDEHFDVDELFIRLKKKSGVSKASIYRTIPLLIEAG